MPTFQRLLATACLGICVLQRATGAAAASLNDDSDSMRRFSAWGYYTKSASNGWASDMRLGSGSASDGDDDELITILILVASFCGILFGAGFIFLIYFTCAVAVRRLRRAVFGIDDDGISERMRRHLLSDDESRQSYELGRAFERQYPYGSVSTQLTDEQQAEIREKGVDAWEFVVDLDVNAMLQSKTEVLFMGGENCVQTNLPLPKTNSVYYFEVKIVEKPTDVNMWIGLATKPYPAWRMVGWNKYSVGYCVNNGSIHQNNPFKGTRVGEQLFVGDIIGIGFQPRSGVVWFTRNGRRYKAIASGMLYDVFPTISADGPCSFSANFGQRGFVFIEANVKRWGFGPIEGSMQPPPVYGADQNTILLEAAVVSSDSDVEDDADIESTGTESGAPKSIAIDIDSNIAESSNTASRPSPFVVVISDPNAVSSNSSRRQHRRRQQPKHRPPQYQEDDPIAAQLLEAGSTSLEPVVDYRNKLTDALDSQAGPADGMSTITESSSESQSQ
ncbi:Protein ssh4 [Coemansia sp. RSA 2703]|nr:Protein ssh4 [Coemansia sp. RSA 2703]KAJ2375070.1 Protein ssh4 [Coemansia sp. RSA 2607]KAJ2397724.1 Protein ssh4 [Coemansia sp. RSA 2603]